MALSTSRTFIRPIYTAVTVRKVRLVRGEFVASPGDAVETFSPADWGEFDALAEAVREAATLGNPRHTECRASRLEESERLTMNAVFPAHAGSTHAGTEGLRTPRYGRSGLAAPPSTTRVPHS